MKVWVWVCHVCLSSKKMQLFVHVSVPHKKAMKSINWITSKYSRKYSNAVDSTYDHCCCEANGPRKIGVALSKSDISIKHRTLTKHGKTIYRYIIVYLYIFLVACMRVKQRQCWLKINANRHKRYHENLNQKRWHGLSPRNPCWKHIETPGSRKGPSCLYNQEPRKGNVYRGRI